VSLVTCALMVMDEFAVGIFRRYVKFQS